MDANAGNPSVQSYRHCLKVSVGALMLESGFNGCEKMSIETITELVQSFLKECGRSSRAFCELAGRTDVLGSYYGLHFDILRKTINLKPFFAINDKKKR